MMAPEEEPVEKKIEKTKVQEEPVAPPMSAGSKGPMKKLTL
jgi:hypothetical protein